MPRPLKRCILGASTIIIAKNIDNMLLCVVQILMKQTLFKLVDFLPSQPESSIKILCEKHGVQKLILGKLLQKVFYPIVCY